MILEHRARLAAAAPVGALVLLHGRGADELDLVPVLDLIDPARRLLGLTPRAPLSLPPGGAHWYVVRRVGYPDPATFASAVEQAGRWLDETTAEAGITPERIVLGGFSQGAVMAYALGLGRGRPRPAAIVALSGFIPTVEGFELDLNGDLPPVAIGHGTYDSVIGVEFGRKARDLLVGAGADVTYRESLLPHAVDPRFAAELAPWLDQALAASHPAQPRSAPPPRR